MNSLKNGSSKYCNQVVENNCPISKGANRSGEETEQGVKVKIQEAEVEVTRETLKKSGLKLKYRKN